MDFVTHAAVGALVGRVVAPRGIGPKPARRYALVGALMAVAPDADHVLEWFSAEAYLLGHRTATHSIPVLAIGLLPIALRVGRRTLLLAALALASHLLLDVLTPFGTALLWPLSQERFALDVLPIVCPWLTGLSLLAAVFGAVGTSPGGRSTRRAAGYGLLAVTLFIALEAAVVLHARHAVFLAQHPGWHEAVAESKRHRETPGLDPADAMSEPMAMRPYGLFVPDWRNPLAAVVLSLSYERYDVSLGGAARKTAEHAMFLDRGVAATREVENEVSEIVLRRRGAKDLINVFRLPVFDVRPTEIVVTDLQFEAVHPGLRPIEIVVPRGGGPPRVVQMELGMQPLLYLAVLALAFAVSRRPEAWR